MRITVHPFLDFDARPGARVRDICDAARAEGVALVRRPWCGDIALDPDHPVGVWPLVEGALLTADRSRPCAPPRGLTATVIAGPDAGGWVGVDRGATIGRDPGCNLPLDDPAVSRLHAVIAPGRIATLTDAGSSNGTARWASGRRRRVLRRVPCGAGALIEAGHSLIHLGEPLALASDALAPDAFAPHFAKPKDAAPDVSASASPPAGIGEALGARLGPLAGSLGTGAMMAAMTGRWWILALGMLYPSYILAPVIAGRFRSRQPSPDLAAIPSPLAESRAFWGDLTGTIAVAGDEHRARGFARAVVLARGRAPREGAWSEPWMSWLAAAQPGDAEVVIVGSDDPPSWAETVIRTHPSGTSVAARGRSRAAPIVSVSSEAAEAWARASAGASRSTALPSTTRLADLDDQDRAAGEPSGRPRRLSAPIGVTAVGPLLFDLDVHGPHVLVAGTTGSGKSALLETLVLALADRHAPDDLHIALIDFKGGAGLRACMALPHVAGVLTDLDPHLARRALAALADELAERKRSLAGAGYASFHAWEAAGDAPPRLLVVADEYQELVAHYREFLPDLTRLAAQGRSLGLHLVLATQRPAGAVTPEIRANIGSTIALRVSSEAESRDLVGSADAAEIPRSLPGRAILAVGGDRTPFQTALPSAEPSPAVSLWSRAPQDADADGLAARVASRWPGPQATPLWLPPLPQQLGEAERPRLAPNDLWLGRGDLPAERTQPELTWDPASGPLVVAGPADSGSTTLLGTLAAQARSRGLEPVWLPSDPREAGRTIVLLRGREDWLLLVDDGARALAGLAEVDRGARHEDLVNMLAWGKPIALALPLSGPQRLASHASVRVVLAGGDPSDEALWSLPRSLQGRGRIPGRGVVGTGSRWMEAQIAGLPAPTPRPLVASLPPRLSPDELPAEGADGLVPIGLGGDDASVVRLDSRRAVLVLGDSGQARESVATAIAQLGQRVGVGVTPRCAENSLLVPRAQLEASTVVIATPTCRLVADVCASDADGLVDPRPGPGRVVVIVDGTARAVQVAAVP